MITLELQVREPASAERTVPDLGQLGPGRPIDSTDHGHVVAIGRVSVDPLAQRVNQARAGRPIAVVPALSHGPS